MPIIKGLLSIPAAIAKALGIALYTIFVAVPYAVLSTIASVLSAIGSAAYAALSFVVSIPIYIVRSVGAGISAVATMLAPYAALALNSIASAFNSYITFMNVINANLANFFAPVANFFAPLLARAPWLVNIARFFQPLARFAPVFKIVQGVLMLAAVPYVVAAGVGVAVAGYATVARFFSNVRVSIYQYFVNKENLPSVTEQFRKHGFLKGMLRAPIAAIGRLAIMSYYATVGNVKDSLQAGMSAFRSTYSATLDLPVFQVMRSAWNGFDEIAQPVSSARIRKIQGDVREINIALGKHESEHGASFRTVKHIRDLIEAVELVPSIDANRRGGRIPPMSRITAALDRDIAALKQQGTTAAAERQKLSEEITSGLVELDNNLRKLAYGVDSVNREQRANVVNLYETFKRLLDTLNDDANFDAVVVSVADAEASGVAPAIKTFVGFTPLARQGLKTLQSSFMEDFYDPEEEAVQDANVAVLGSSLRHDSL